MKLLKMSILCLLTSCTHLNSISITQIPTQRSRIVRAEASKLIFLGINFNNNFVNSIYEDLTSKCLGGKIQGILTKDEDTSYFFAVRKRITVMGYCLK